MSGLPSASVNTLDSTGEMHSHTLIFTEGEALRFFHVWGNLHSYYEIHNDVKRLGGKGCWTTKQENMMTREVPVLRRMSPEFISGWTGFSRIWPTFGETATVKSSTATAPSPANM